MNPVKKLKPDTIVAIATPTGQGAIGVVRISGARAEHILNEVWRATGNKHLRPRELTLGWVVDGDKKLDQALVVFMPSPNSYTGEDVAEIHTHGSTAIAQAVLKLALKHGARLAEPGEFTKRAYLNGKMDLVQAEAVGELIASENEAMARLACDQLAGGLSRAIKSIRDEVIKLTAHLTANLDFSEEDIDTAETNYIVTSLNTAEQNINRLLLSSEQLVVLRSGFKVALVGLPNAGKSTLLNHLIGYERSIVANVPGTTRDTIEEAVNINGIKVRLVDTAGLNVAPGEIEELGIERTKAEINNSDLILLLVAPGQEIATKQYIHAQKLFSKIANISKQLVVVWTKSDLGIKPSRALLGLKPSKYINTSALNDKGLENIHQIVAQSVNSTSRLEGVATTTIRQIEVLKNSIRQIENTVSALNSGVASDAIIVDLEEIIRSLGGLTGDMTNQEVLDSIFENFCVGK